MYLGKNVNEYNSESKKIINRHIMEKRLLCALCTLPMGRHSKYTRGVKETGEEIEITIVRCKACKKGCALLPDFLLQYKQYSGNEIESVIIDSATHAPIEIETEASESTVRRWIAQIGERLKMAVGVLKHLFMQAGRTISEISIEAGHIYSELEQILDKAPKAARHTNKLGLANMWLGTHSRKNLI
jgi:hypothetical protein